MNLIKKGLCLVAWFIIYFPTTLFVLAVMVKTIWSSGRGKASIVDSIAALPLAVQIRNTIRGRRSAA